MANLVHLAPYPDDEMLGSPATLLKMQRAGWTVFDVIVSLGRPHQRARRRAEAEEAAARAGFEPIFLDPPLAISRCDDLAAGHVHLTNELGRIMERYRPQIIVSPSPHDGHHGHEVVGRAVQHVLSGRNDGTA